MNRYPVGFVGCPGSGIDRDLEQSIRDATRARIAAGPVEGLAPVVDWAAFIRSETEAAQRRSDWDEFIRSAEIT